MFNDQLPDGLAAGDLLAANYTRQERDILRSEIGKLRAQITAVTKPPARSISNGRGLVVPAYCLTDEKISPQTAQNGTPHIRANLPRWVGFSARAGPQNLATNNPQNPKTDADRLSLSTFAGVKGRMPSPAWIKLAQFNTGEGAKQLPSPDCQNSASGTNELSRQACRHLSIMTPLATHGCVAPESMDGRASLNPDLLMPPDTLLASLASVEFVASRPDSDLSFSADAQNVNHHSGDISPTKYLLCEVQHTATIGQADDSVPLPDTAATVSGDGKPTTAHRSPCSSSCGCYPVSSTCF